MQTSKLQSVAPVLLVRNVIEAAAYYQDKLGFTAEGFFGEAMTFCILNRDGCRLMLQQVENPKDVIPHWTVVSKTPNAYFWVNDANLLYAEFKARGAKMDYGPCDQP